MRKLPFILLFLSYMGAMFCPMGDFSCMRNIPDSYRHCKAEDPDIDPIDFVLEHCMNLGSIIAQLEGDEDEEGERPHQPVQQIQSLTQVLVIAGHPEVFQPRSHVYFAPAEIIYSLYAGDFVPNAGLSEVFHPPSDC
jgi:hypothetical protein